MAVKFDSLPTAGSQDQGIIVQTDANNYLRFDVYSNGSTQYMFAASFVNNSPTVQANVAISGAKAPFWIRVNRTGNSGLIAGRWMARISPLRPPSLTPWW